MFIVVGLELAFSVAAGLILGSYVDKWLETDAPYFTLLGLLAGAFTGFSLLLRLLKYKKNENKD